MATAKTKKKTAANPKKTTAKKRTAKKLAAPIDIAKVVAASVKARLDKALPVPRPILTGFLVPRGAITEAVARTLAGQVAKDVGAEIGAKLTGKIAILDDVILVGYMPRPEIPRP
jgi:ribosomal protein S25